jgi:hypothetical protein
MIKIQTFQKITKIILQLKCSFSTTYEIIKIDKDDTLKDI